MVSPDKHALTFQHVLRNVSLPDLEAFVIVTQLRSFTQTADVLHISQPAVTQRIRRLERAVGSQLIKRGSSGAEVTSTGKRFVEKLIPALESLKDAVQSVSGEDNYKNQELLIASTPFIASVALPGLLHTFLVEHEKARVTLQDLSYEEVLEALEANVADLAILADYTGQKFDPEILDSTEVIIAVPATHPLAGQEIISISCLANVDIYLNHQYLHLFKKIEAFAQDQKEIDLPKAHLVQGMSTVVGMVNAAMGPALMTRNVAEAYCASNTAVLQIQGMPLKREYSLLKSRQAVNSPLMSELIEHIRQGFVRED